MLLHKPLPKATDADIASHIDANEKQEIRYTNVWVIFIDFD